VALRRHSPETLMDFACAAVALKLSRSRAREPSSASAMRLRIPHPMANGLTDSDYLQYHVMFIYSFTVNEM
jgi:hypothetical protein